VSKVSRKSKKGGLAAERLPLMNLDDGIVGWESQDDPDMPLNFPMNQKWFLLSLISSITFLSPLASSMFAPGVEFMDADFGNTSTILSAFTVSIYVLGYAIGPLVLSPLSEIYGRRVVLAGANCFFTVWQIGCALAPNLGSLIAFRFLSGMGGSGCLTIGGGVIADLFPPDQRGLASSIYSVGPLFGPAIGPICGGFIAERTSWRWVFWVLFIATAVVSVAIECFNRETNPRVLMARKTTALQKSLNRPELRSCYEDLTVGPQTKGSIFRNGILRPLKMLFKSPIVFLLSLYMAVVYGLLYLLFTTITSVFQTTYHWSTGICGLAYLGLAFGFIAGIITVAKVSDATVVRMTKANDDVFEPEMRLPACVFFACFVPVTFFWYGWSADKAAPWAVTLIGLAPFGFGMIGIFIPIQTYLIDSFPMFAASAVAALTCSRSVFGALLPLAAPSMYKSLGLGWGNSVLGFIAIALIPAPAAMYKYGGVIRKKYPIKL
jgi:multidrug resistance protein